MTTHTAPAPLTTTLVGDREVQAVRIFNASLDRTWRAYTDVDIVKQWWGRGNPLDVIRWEFEVGGHWRFVEHSDGETHGFEGRFREITPKERISQTFEWDGMPGHVTIDTATFEDLGDGRTRLTTHSHFFTQEERDGMVSMGMAEGQEQSYKALDALFERGVV